MTRENDWPWETRLWGLREWQEPERPEFRGRDRDPVKEISYIVYRIFHPKFKLYPKRYPRHIVKRG